LEFEVCDFTFFHSEGLSHNGILLDFFLVHPLTLRIDLYISFLSGVTLTGGVETILVRPLLSNFHFHLFFFSLESPIAKALGSPFPIFAMTLPEEFTELGEITYLSLSHCQLTAIPEYLSLALFPHLDIVDQSPTFLFIHYDGSLSELDWVGPFKKLDSFR